MKVKTTKDNVLTLNKKGTILEVTETEAKRLQELGVVEVVEEKKPAPKSTPKATNKKKTTKEGE